MHSNHLFHRNLVTLAALYGTICTFSTVAKAAVTEDLQIVKVTTDAVAGEVNIKGVQDEDLNVTMLRQVAPEETKDITLEELNKGVVLFKQGDYEVVKLVSEKYDGKIGADAHIVYLYNGITNTYKKFPFEVHRDGDKWSLMVNERTGRRTFTQMFMKAKKVLGKIVGIEKITVQ
jgi:hypothetical protein